jgi:transcriptional regulator of heat shock response
MAEITSRQEDLLYALIGEYIRIGAAVSSDDLRKRYRFPYSPATIRNDLVQLSEMGYLHQPHTSAGRIPTDFGYRWYANRIAATPRLGSEERRVAADLTDRLDQDVSDFFKASTEAIAEITRALVIGGTGEDKSEPFFKSGFSRILSEPEFHDQGLRNRFGELIDSIDEEVRQLVIDQDFSKPRVFIGRENPIPEARDYSMIVTTFKTSSGSGIIAILGAKRMRYDKGISLLSVVNELIRDS